MFPANETPGTKSIFLKQPDQISPADAEILPPREWPVVLSSIKGLEDERSEALRAVFERRNFHESHMNVSIKPALPKVKPLPAHLAADVEARMPEWLKKLGTATQTSESL